MERNICGEKCRGEPKGLKEGEKTFGEERSY
jgi:hypothetical protein